jgi:hypothetical protein
MKDLTFADIKFHLEKSSITSAENFQNIRLKDTVLHPVHVMGQICGHQTQNLSTFYLGVPGEKMKSKTPSK